MSLQVISPGTYSLVVDEGRPKTRSQGIAMGGPADRAGYSIGNALVGNFGSFATLEITLSGPTLIAMADLCAIVMGSPFAIHRDDESLDAGQVFQLRKGQTLRIGGTSVGCRAYLCVPGGFNAPMIAGSQSSFVPILSRERLECGSHSSPLLSLEPSNYRELLGMRVSTGSVALRCLPGPQQDWFPESIFANVYRVSSAGNRMGIRLEGPKLKCHRELISEPVAPGAIQIANDGKPIILGVDGQTIGGYPKPAHVIDADLDLLGQLRPGQTVRFVEVNESQAEEAGRIYREQLAHWTSRIKLSTDYFYNHKL